MSIQKLHWLIKQRFNKLDSNHYRDLTPLEIDEAINDATFLLVSKIDTPEFQPYIEMVANLVITYPQQPLVEPVASAGDVYEFDLNNLVYPYFSFKRAYANTDCGLTKVELVSQGRLNDVLADQFSKPSKKWRRLIGTLAKSSQSDGYSLYIYSESGFEIENLALEYVRQPVKVFYGGYDSVEYLECLQNGGTTATCSQYYSSTDSPVDSEIDETYHTVLADYAVRELSRILKDVPSFQLQSEKVNSHNV